MKHLTCLLVLSIGCGGDGSGTKLPDAPVFDDGATPTTVNLTLEDQPTDPAMFEFVVAFQDGDGAFTVAGPPTGNVYSFPVDGDHWGYAWTCRQPMGQLAATPDVRIVQLGFFTIADRTDVTDRVPGRCHEAPATVTLSGTVTNRPVAGAPPQLVATYGTASAAVDGITGNFTLSVEPGTHDLVISRINSPAQNDDIVVSAAVVRDVAVTANTTKNVDFLTAANAQTFAITVNTTGNQRAVTSTTLRTGNDTRVAMVSDSNAPLETNSFAAAQTLSTDVFDTVVTVSNAGAVQVQTIAATTPVAMTVDPPAPLGGATATVSTATPYITINSTWQAYPNAIGYHWGATQAVGNKADCGGVSATCTIDWAADLSAAYLGSSTQFTMPDLSALAGWTVAHQFVAGTQIAGTAQAITSTAGATDFPLQPPGAGTIRTNVRSAWTTTP